MKTRSLLIFLLVVFLGITNCHAQYVPTYPIPSYNIIVDPVANFSQSVQAAKTELGKEKRGITVKLRQEALPCDCFAEIWFYTRDQTTILGPYTLQCGESIRVEIDEREWGVLVQSEDVVIVDVWYD
jgi:hypothetical protein